MYVASIDVPSLVDLKELGATTLVLRDGVGY